MLILITGTPGASKTLNTVKMLCRDKKYQGRAKYYHNVRLFLLDYQQCKTFQAWFYDVYLAGLPANQKRMVQDELSQIHAQKRLAELTDFPFLEKQFQQHRPLQQWLNWVRRCYDSTNPKLKQLNSIIREAEKNGVELTFLDFQHLNLHFTHFDKPQEWFKLPAQTVLFIDEAQEFFPVRDGKTKVPEYASRFERHRHDAFDVIVVTQHPNFVDIHLRRLAGQHIHYFNFFNSNRVARYTWDKCSNPDDKEALKAATRSITKKDSRFYGSYLSATEHTHKLRLPKLLFLIPLLLLLAVGGILAAYAILEDEQDKQSQEQQSKEDTTKAASTIKAVPIQNTESYLKQYEPRVTGLEHTAPAFDHLTQPESFPKPKNCIVNESKNICRCYSQRVTRMDIPESLCRHIARNGYYDYQLSDEEFRQRRIEQQEQITRRKYFQQQLQNIDFHSPSRLGGASDSRRPLALRGGHFFWKDVPVTRLK